MSDSVKAETFRILAKDCLISNDSHKCCNKNDCIIGQSGSGKTQGFVIPNILQTNESMIIADTKGNLVRKLGPFLKKEGYRVELIDLKEMKSTVRYNPLGYISYDNKKHTFSEQDILKVAHALIPEMDAKDPYWTQSARVYLALLISYVLEFTPANEHTLRTVMDLYRTMETGAFETLMSEARDEHPNSYTSRLYRQVKNDRETPKTYRCIRMFVSSPLTGLTFDKALAIYENPNRFRFRTMGKGKTALFLNISDTDRSMDMLVSLLYTQAFQDLCDYADHECAGQKLPVPTRFLLDDFCTNTYIEDFDKIISVIRSREISVSIIIQSLGQLNSHYGEAKAGTILDNIDTVLFMGGHSEETVDYVAKRADVPTGEVLDMGPDEAYLFTGGCLPRKVHKFDLTEHPRYTEITGPAI